jgi:hypothetical protein
MRLYKHKIELKSVNAWRTNTGKIAGVTLGTERLKHRLPTPAWNYNHSRVVDMYNSLTKMEGSAVNVTVIRY